MIRNDDLAGIAATQVEVARGKMIEVGGNETLLLCTCILMAAHLIVDAIETASKQSD